MWTKTDETGLARWEFDGSDIAIEAHRHVKQAIEWSRQYDVHLIRGDDDQIFCKTDDKDLAIKVAEVFMEQYNNVGAIMLFEPTVNWMEMIDHLSNSSRFEWVYLGDKNILLTVELIQQKHLPDLGLYISHDSTKLYGVVVRDMDNKKIEIISKHDDASKAREHARIWMEQRWIADNIDSYFSHG